MYFVEMGEQPKQESTEVHYHPHRPHGKRKGFSAYFLEFLMIFLAVTLGFFAESLRERMADREKEEQYIRSLEEDLKRDTAQLNGYMNFKLNTLRYCDSLQQVIAYTDVMKRSDAVYNYSRELARYIRYYPADRTIQQLKSSGNMRLIRKWNVSNAVAGYDNKTANMAEVDFELNEEILRYRRYLIEFLDLSEYDRRNPAGSFMEANIQTRGNPLFIHTDPVRLKVLYNEVFTLKAFLLSCNYNAADLKSEATKLLFLLEHEY